MATTTMQTPQLRRSGTLIATATIIGAIVLGIALFFFMKRSTMSNMGHVQNSAITTETPTERAGQTAGESTSGSGVGMYQDSNTSGVDKNDDANTSKPTDGK